MSPVEARRQRRVFPRVWGPGGKSAETHRVRKHRFAGMRWARSGEAAGSLPVRNPGFRRWPPVPIWAAPPES